MLFTFLRAFIRFNLYSLAETQRVLKNVTLAAGGLVMSWEPWENSRGSALQGT